MTGHKFTGPPFPPLAELARPSTLSMQMCLIAGRRRRSSRRRRNQVVHHGERSSMSMTQHFFHLSFFFRLVMLQCL